MRKSRLLEKLLKRMRNQEYDGGYDPNVIIRLMSKETCYRAGSQSGELNKGGMYSLYFNEKTEEFMLVEDDTDRFIYEYEEFVDDHVFSKLLEQFVIIEDRSYYSFMQFRNREQSNVVSNEVISFIENSLPHTRIIKTWMDSRSEVITRIIISSSKKDDLSLLSNFLHDTIKQFYDGLDSLDRELDEILELDVDIMEFAI